MTLVSGDALIICGGDLAHIDTETGAVTSSVGVLHTYPNDVVIQGDYAFVVNSGVDQGTLQRFELETWLLTELGIGTGWNCWAALPLTDGNLAVSATLNNSICMVNSETMQLLSIVNGVAPNPEWMDADNDLLYVACGGWGAGESVVVINITTGTVVNTFTAGTNCQSLISHGNGKLFVTCSGTYGNDDGSVVVLNSTTGAVEATLPVGGFPGFSAASNGTFYTADPWGGGVFAIDMETLTVLHDKDDPFCTGGNGLAADESGNLWVTDSMNGEVRVYDETKTLVHTYTVGNPGPIAVSGSYMGISGGVHPSDAGITLSPNPAVNFVTVSGAEPGTMLRVYDIYGRIVSEVGIPSSGQATVSVQYLAPGLYTAVNGLECSRFSVTQ